MCAIAGVLTRRPVEEAHEAVGRMIASSRHRGPDGSGQVSVPLPGAWHLVLGHARLAILDLTQAAAQPMLDQATGSWLVYNGEIYNFRELREELVQQGCTFRSRGDTEVMLQALAIWGEDALPRLRGMYAFAFWDAPRQRLLLGRDPLGIKPLLLGRESDSVVFASELRALRAARLLRLSLNESAMRSFLVYGMTVEPTTIASEVIAVPPGHLVTVHADGQVRPPKVMWSLGELFNHADNGARRSAMVSVRDVRDELTRTVKAHLVSNAPLGVFLSGGVDSSVVATLAAMKGQGQEFRLLTVDHAESQYSEIRYARQVAARLGRAHHVVKLTPGDVLRIIPRALEAMDQPTVDGVNTYVISSAAADLGIKTLLSGLGGDEVFGGYTTFWKVPRLARHAQWLAPLGQVAPGVWPKNEAQWHKLAQSRHVCGLAGAYLLQRSIRWCGAAGGLHTAEVPPDEVSIPPETWDALATDEAVHDVYRVAGMEASFYMRNQLLRDADIFGSANSVEIRVPFVSTDLISKAWQLPARTHVTRLGRGKKVLKGILKAAHPGLDVNRRKMGFLFPWSCWLRGPLRDTVRDTFDTRRLFPVLSISHKDADDLLARFAREDPLVSWAQVWSLFVLLRWRAKFQLPA